MQALYLTDSYLKEFEAEIESVNDKFVILNQSAFYPNSGGQPYDTGVIVKDNIEFKVVYVGKFEGKISHEVDKKGLKVGDKVHCKIDLDRRYKLMRMHTAAHLLSGVMHKKTGALITGNQLNLDKSRIDFSLEDFDRDILMQCIDESNQLVDKELLIKTYSVLREEAEQMEGIAKLASGLPSAIKEIRIIEIETFDKQADGGTHVKNTKEVGYLKLLKADNKGKNNRRVYFELENPKV